MSIKKTEVTDNNELTQIIKNADVCTLSMVDESNLPYAVPMNFGYEEGVFYLHAAPEGRKINILKKKPEVCITLSIAHELNIRHENVACSYSMKYQSVQAFGKLEFIEDLELKRKYMNIIMGQYCDRTDFKYNDPAIKNVTIMKVEATNISGHNRGYQN